MNNSIPIERINPKQAERYLNSNRSNRRLRSGLVEKYADDMRNGRWTRCPMPICFYQDGDIADGQHRLWAIIESGTTQEFAVVYGLRREDGLNIDTGMPRTLVDNADISGADKHLSNELISVCRAIAEGERHGKALSNSTRLAMVTEHREAAQWAITNGPRGRGLRNAILLAAVARAWYRESDHARLRRFSEVVSTGFADDKNESGAIALRNYIQAKGAATSGSPATWRDAFLKAQNCIAYFMRRQPLTVVKKVSEEAYPIKKG